MLPWVALLAPWVPACKNRTAGWTVVVSYLLLTIVKILHDFQPVCRSIGLFALTRHT